MKSRSRLRAMSLSRSRTLSGFCCRQLTALPMLPLPNPKKLLERVHTAEAVIFNRLQALAQIPDSPEHAAERQAMEDALNALRVLKRNKLNFPDWETK